MLSSSSIAELVARPQTFPRRNSWRDALKVKKEAISTTSDDARNLSCRHVYSTCNHQHPFFLLRASRNQRLTLFGYVGLTHNDLVRKTHGSI